jgi:hypothetical protein
MSRRGWWGALLLLGTGAVQAAGTPLRAAVVPIVGQAEFLSTVLAPFLAERGQRLELTAVHGREVVRLARAGKADLVIMHARFKALPKLRRDDVIGPPVPVFANPIALLAPAGDPAGAAAAPDAASAMARIKAARACLLENALEGLLAVQRKLWAEGGCRLQQADAVGLGAVLAAQRLGAYTWWGLHPFANSAQPMTPLVWGEPPLLRTLVAAPVAGTPGATLAAEAIAWLNSPAGRRAVAAFRLPGYPAVQAFWPPPTESSTPESGDPDE